MTRREFPLKIKLAAWQRSGGRCENALCQCKIRVGRARYDHIIADGLTGEPTLANCSVLCVDCHDEKTRKHDIPAIAKAKRRELRHAGIKKPRTIQRWRKFDGSIVIAGRER